MLKRIKQWIKNKYRLGFMRYGITRAWLSNPLVCHCRDYTQSDFVRNLIRILVTPYCALKWFVNREVPGCKGLAFVLIAKNEATYIKEWLDFHIKQGVSKFIIYDNESTDNFREVLSPYIESGIVIYDIIRGKRRQTDAYNIALNKYGNRFKYMGLIDADEFVFVRNNTYGGNGNLCEFMDKFMAEHPNAGGIGINWLIFGSSHHEKRPAGGVLENFTMCAEKSFVVNHHIKTIFDPLKAMSAGVHYPIYRRGSQNLDENGKIISGTRTEQVNFDKIRINHYFTKSKEETIAKLNKGVATAPVLRTMGFFNANDRNEVIDTDILSRK